MSKDRHTPGPWEDDDFIYPNNIEIRASSGRAIGTVYCPPMCDHYQIPDDGRPESEANARLVCAAPALLDLARACLDHLRELSDVMDVDSYALETRLESVIEEATGGDDANHTRA